MKNLTILLWLACFVPMLAQENSEINTAQSDFKITQGPILTFNVFTPVMGYTPRYRVGYIQPVTGPLMIGADVGYGREGIVFDFNPDRSRQDYSLFEVRGEVYYLLNVNRNGDHYLSFETHYLNHTETFFDEAIEFDDQPNLLYEQADYSRNRIAFTIKYGAFYYLSERLGLNAYYGMGLRIRNNSFSNVIPVGGGGSPDNSDGNGNFYDDDEEWDFGTNNYYREDGRNVGLNIALGIKLFYQF